MVGVLAATITKLRELQTIRGRLFVLRRGVVALFALATLQCHDFTHCFILIDSQNFCEIFKPRLRAFEHISPQKP